MIRLFSGLVANRFGGNKPRDGASRGMKTDSYDGLANGVHLDFQLEGLSKSAAQAFIDGWYQEIENMFNL
jgi:hypothetical protein